MPARLDTDLTRLKEQLLKMGAIAEQMIRDVVTVVVDRDSELLEKVCKNEEQMDLLQNDVDEETVRLIGVHTPVAGDLRLLLVVARINAELERIGDQATNIGFYAKALLKEEQLKPLIDIPRLAEMAEHMLGRALDAFTERSTDLALGVIKSDDDVDNLHDQIFRELMTYVIGDAKTIGRVLELILIARAFERIADHSVSIAEDVVYMVKGQNVRHMHDTLDLISAPEDTGGGKPKA